MNTNCRIGKVKPKGNLTLFPSSINNVKTFNLEWGQITFRMFDDHDITHETMMYMLRAAETKILNE